MIEIKKIIDKVGALKDHEKALIKSSLSFLGVIFALIVATYYFLSNQYVRGSIYLLAGISFSLMFISFCSQYRTFKFLLQFSAKYNG